MTGWTYIPGGDCANEFYDYPDDFEFGLGDDDDRVFEEAWNAMKAKGVPIVRFDMGEVPHADDLERYGLVLYRWEFHADEVDKLADRVTRGMIAPLVAMKSMNFEIANSVREAIFMDHAEAMLTASRFNGRMEDAR